MVLSDLLELRSMKKMRADEATVEKVVNNNNKKRFQIIMKDGVKMIRAV